MGWVGWLETDNMAISVQLNLTGTATGTELGKIQNKVSHAVWLLDRKIMKNEHQVYFFLDN